MGAPYAQDLRDRVLAAYDRGMLTKQIADTFQVSPAWARRVKQRRREHGETKPRPMGGATVVKIDMQRLAELVREQPDATLDELAERLDCGCGATAVCMALKRAKITFKKRRSTPRSRTARMLPSAASSGKKVGLRSTPVG
ncbi:MAG: IS630 transposase-related protein [Phycisphaeraceae bacterium]